MSEIKLVTLDPGHFHAALIQKEMYPGVSPLAHVYAPLGADLSAHLNRIAGFNQRRDNPTAWELEIHACADFLGRMLGDRPGNVVVLSGRNRRKIDLIQASVEAGLHVLADKPWIIHSGDLPKLESVLQTAERKAVIAYDVMTERFEITSILQRELVADPEVFGEPLAGDEQEPGVYMESVHYLMKTVAGVPNLRPAWFFDIEEQGEGLADVGTHLVDMVPWTVFPDQPVDHRTDLKILTGRRWPTVLSVDDFRRVTGQPGAAKGLDYFCNNSVSYTLRGIHVKLDVLWNFEAAPGTGDTYISIFRGSKARVEIRQGAEENYRPELYVVGAADTGALGRRMEAIAAAFPGVGLEENRDRLRVAIPDKYRIGHEAHFAQVALRFLDFVDGRHAMPAWENPNMLSKYFVTTKGVDRSREAS